MKATLIVISFPECGAGHHSGGPHSSRHVPRVQWTRHDEGFRLRNHMVGEMDASLIAIAEEVTAAFATANENSRQYNAVVTAHAERLLHGGRVDRSAHASYAERTNALSIEYMSLQQRAIEAWTRFEAAARAAYPVLEEKYRIVFDGTTIGWNDYPRRYEDDGEWYPPAPFEQRLMSQPLPRRRSRRSARGSRGK